MFAPEHVVSVGLEALCRYLAGNGVDLPVPTKMLISPPRQSDADTDAGSE
ncbi:hypothetical protein [Streptomyces halstedii]